MADQDESSTFHALAKDAGNRLRAYILSVSSGATAVFFFSLTQAKTDQFSDTEKWLLGLALFCYMATVALCLFELRVDARRFFALTKELRKPETERRWDQNERYKTVRYWLIHASYITLSFAVILTGTYLLMRIVGS